MIEVTIISDAVCPWCLIGKRHFEAALAQRPELDVKVEWRPFQLNPDIPVEGMDRKTAIAAKFGSLENARQIYERVSQAGEQAGVKFDFEAIPKTPNTLNAHRLIHWAAQAGVQDQMVEALFRRFFQDGEDIGDSAVLIEAATEAGLDAESVGRKLASDDDLELVRQQDFQARSRGINGVPFFVFNNKYGLSGAQPPETFLQVLEQLEQETA
jgi:predicted DsbA family dithiol-disulfide isomerase